MSQYKYGGGGGAAFDLLERRKTVAEFHDDFLSGEFGPSLGQSEWNITETAGGGDFDAGSFGSGVFAGGVKNRVGYVSLKTGGASNGGLSLHKQEHQLILGGGIVTVVGGVLLPDLPDETQDFRIHFGLTRSRDPFSFGVGFLVERSVSADKWIMCCEDGIATKTPTSVDVTTGWTDLKFVVNADASSVEFFINGVSVGTVTTHIPDGASDYLVPQIEIEKLAGTSERRLIVDDYGLRYEFTTPRAA